MNWAMVADKCLIILSAMLAGYYRVTTCRRGPWQIEISITASIHSCFSFHPGALAMNCHGTDSPLALWDLFGKMHGN